MIRINRSICESCTRSSTFQKTTTIGEGLCPRCSRDRARATSSCNYAFMFLPSSTFLQWYNTCIQSHKHCDTAVTHQPPARLLNVGDDVMTSTVSLVDSETLPDSPTWVALSYCWGGDQSIQTKKANLAQHYRGLAVDSLPRTLRDAIFITQQLGQSYLWIDCLCIYQDDDGDKGKEIRKMPDIYQGEFSPSVLRVQRLALKHFYMIIHDHRTYYYWRRT